MTAQDPGTSPKTCPLCGSACEASRNSTATDDVRPGFTTIMCSGRCGEFLISEDSIEIAGADVKQKLAWLARLLRKEDRGCRLEVTPGLILVLQDLSSRETQGG
ncbi:MAG: hypothetical protein L6R30_16985 [Thermoanaerobaculia bacterium]|nr:hypothetical protein [Thermoanaerobaculia bacterium]